jgi:hypothetical protein
MDYVVNQPVGFPESLKKLSLDYYFENIHSGFLKKLPNSLETLTLECARIHRYDIFGSLIETLPSLMNLKVSSSSFGFDPFFKNIKNKKFKSLHIA